MLINLEMCMCVYWSKQGINQLQEIKETFQSMSWSKADYIGFT